MAPATAVSVSKTAGAVEAPATISTNCMRGAGLKKCIPAIFAGYGVAAAIFVTDNEEVLVAKTASGKSSINRLNKAIFAASSSAIASMNKSALQERRPGAQERRLIAFSFSAADNLPFVTIRSR